MTIFIIGVVGIGAQGTVASGIVVVIWMVMETKGFMMKDTISILGAQNSVCSKGYSFTSPLALLQITLYYLLI